MTEAVLLLRICKQLANEASLFKLGVILNNNLIVWNNNPAGKLPMGDLYT